MTKILQACQLHILLILLPFTLSAQQLFNASYSNYSGLSGVSWNPATLADNRCKVQLQIIAVDAHGTNNAYRYVGPWSLRESGSGFRVAESQQIGKNKQPKLFSAGLQVRGPGVLVRLSAKHSVALSTRVRTAVQGNNISHDILQNAIDMYQYRSSTSGNELNSNLNAFSEWDLSYGGVVYNQGAHFFKAGVTIKRLLGISSAFVQGKNIAYEIGSRRYPESDTTLRIQQFDGAFGYANPDALSDLDVSMALRWLTMRQSPGMGWGADLGVVYEFCPDFQSNSNYSNQRPTNHNQKDYRFRLSAALTDIGAINYRRNATVYNELALRNVGINNKELNGINLGNYTKRAEDILHTSGQRKQTQFKAGLPTALNIDFDYHIKGKFYVNAALSQGLRNPEAIGMRNFSYASLSPRLEAKWIEIALAVSQTNNYQLLAYGAMVRLGPLTIGSNNLLGLIDSSNPYGANAYAEVSLMKWANKKLKYRNKA